LVGDYLAPYDKGNRPNHSSRSNPNKHRFRAGGNGDIPYNPSSRNAYDIYKRRLLGNNRPYDTSRRDAGKGYDRIG
jgi:hypothetical protein